MNFNLIFQVYKITNLNLEGKKAVYLATCGLFELMKNEAVIISAAKEVDASGAEMEFNGMVQAALENYTVFKANLAVQSTPIQRGVIINFAELFDYVINIKKREEIRAQQAAVQGVAVAIPQEVPPQEVAPQELAVDEDGEPSNKRNRRRI